MFVVLGAIIDVLLLVCGVSSCIVRCCRRYVLVIVVAVLVVGVAFVIGLAVGHGIVVVTLLFFCCAVVHVFLLVLCRCACWFARVL